MSWVLATFLPLAPIVNEPGHSHRTHTPHTTSLSSVRMSSLPSGCPSRVESSRNWIVIVLSFIGLGSFVLKYVSISK